jgi:membrane protein DedA with SNARE-associated domain
MGTLNTALAQHGYFLLAAIVFLEAIGVPVPAAVALLIAGGAVSRGVLQAQYALSIALFAMLAADTLMFLLGRYTGWWLLGLLCRISLNPEACILRSADSFYRRGRTLLVIAKFIPGINTMAPPLAGSMNMRLATFLRLDLAGAVLYIGSYFAAGFVFSGALEAVTRGYDAVGRIAGWAVIALVVAYVLFRVWLWVRGRGLSAVPFATPADAARNMADGASVYDVRSHGHTHSGVSAARSECASPARSAIPGRRIGLRVLHLRAPGHEHPRGEGAADDAAGTKSARDRDSGRPARLGEGRLARRRGATWRSRDAAGV